MWKSGLSNACLAVLYFLKRPADLHHKRGETDKKQIAVSHCSFSALLSSCCHFCAATCLAHHHLCPLKTSWTVNALSVDFIMLITKVNVIDGYVFRLKLSARLSSTPVIRKKYYSLLLKGEKRNFCKQWHNFTSKDLSCRWEGVSFMTFQQITTCETFIQYIFIINTVCGIFLF